MTTLLIRLAGTHQSWSSGPRLPIQPTEREPTASGVVGLLACALGRTRSEPIDDLARLPMGVRVDREGRDTIDFQTAFGGHDARPAEPVLTEKHYLADASFLVGLEGPLRQLQEIEGALRRPRWPLYLGRRACIPSLPAWLPGGGLRDVPLEVALRQAAAPAPAREGPVQAAVWLSRMVLNTRRWDVPADLRNPDAMHRRLCRLFPRDPVDWFADAPGSLQPASEARVTKSRAEVSLLWRLETPPHPAPPYVLFQATEAPRWDALPAGYARGTDSKPLALAAIEGALFRFRLRATPVYQPDDHSRGRRHVAVKGPGGRLEWLDRRAASWGFAVVGATEQRESMVKFRNRADSDPSDPLKIVASLFGGLLRVTEPDSFRRACVTGCGRCRPYGFGLLSLGRP